MLPKFILNFEHLAGSECYYQYLFKLIIFNEIMLIGLVGKPSCGKSTFFKAATLADVLIAAYPFATIKPNQGVGYVKIDCIDKELNVQCNPSKGYCVDGKRFVPIDLLDVAGLVKGASEGKGLGNQFLSDLTNADALIHIVDVSGETDAEGKETKGYNPVQDVQISCSLTTPGESRYGFDYADKKRTRRRPIQVILAAFPKSISSTDLRLGIAAGPWKTWTSSCTRRRCPRSNAPSRIPREATRSTSTARSTCWWPRGTPACGASCLPPRRHSTARVKRCPRSSR